MGNEDQALIVQNADSLVPAKDPQEAQERRLKEVRCLKLAQGAPHPLHPFKFANPFYLAGRRV
jgi:hypothetical protein